MLADELTYARYYPGVFLDFADVLEQNERQFMPILAYKTQVKTALRTQQKRIGRNISKR